MDMATESKAWASCRIRYVISSSWKFSIRDRLHCNKKTCSLVAVWRADNFLFEYLAPIAFRAPSRAMYQSLHKYVPWMNPTQIRSQVWRGLSYLIVCGKLCDLWRWQRKQANGTNTPTTWFSKVVQTTTVVRYPNSNDYTRASTFQFGFEKTVKSLNIVPFEKRPPYWFLGPWTLSGATSSSLRLTLNTWCLFWKVKV